MKLEELQPGDLIFDHTHDLFGLLIRKITRSWANHIALYIGDGKVIEANPGGIKINSVNKYLTPILRKVSIFRIKATSIQLYDMIENAKEMQDYKYDYFQIISLLFLYITKLHKKVPGFQIKKFTICSELIDISAEKAGINFTNKFSSNVTPDDIMKSDILIQIA